MTVAKEQYMSQHTTKPTKRPVSPAKIQIQYISTQYDNGSRLSLFG